MVETTGLLREALQDDYPNLSWIGHGKYASEFNCDDHCRGQMGVVHAEARFGALQPRTKSVNIGLIAKGDILHVEHRWESVCDECPDAHTAMAHMGSERDIHGRARHAIHPVRP